MSSGTEPVIVTLTSPARVPRRAFLADVLIVLPDHRATAERCRELFSRFPGLTVVVISDGSGAIDAGFRDGTTLALEFAPPAPAADLTRNAALMFYAWWAMGGGRSSGGQLRVQVGRWTATGA